MARKKMISAHAALKQSEPNRIAEIKQLRREISKLLKNGEAVYIEKGTTDRCSFKLV